MTTPSPGDAHREEIFEGLIEASLKGREEDFYAFKTEWERIDSSNTEEFRINFPPGAPIPYTSKGFCHHCQREWLIAGVAFGSVTPGIAQMIHMGGECEEIADCTCWDTSSNVEDEELNPFGYPLCQSCMLHEDHCECEEGVAYGPCALYEKNEREHGLTWQEEQ
jgi:hypothetical protein